jgi:hypothetical protein
MSPIMEIMFLKLDLNEIWGLFVVSCGIFSFLGKYGLYVTDTRQN